MMLVIVFSRDRALQLQATLSSFALQVPDAAAAMTVVLYRATTPRHQKQYEQLEESLRGSVSFTPESEFRTQIIGLLDASLTGIARPSRDPGAGDSGDHCLFLVDDSIFVRPLQLGHAAEALTSNPDALGFSLRLGRNTTYCYSSNRPQSLPRFEDVGNGMLKFPWQRSDGDFGYPLEISSSLYRLPMAADLIHRLDFSGPSSLESQMSTHARDFSCSHPAMLCCAQSVAFSTPLNRVQEVYQNRSGRSPAFSTESLADLFDQGKHINVRALAGFTPRACHEEVELQFE